MAHVRGTRLMFLLLLSLTSCLGEKTKTSSAGERENSPSTPLTPPNNPPDNSQTTPPTTDSTSVTAKALAPSQLSPSNDSTLTGNSENITLSWTQEDSNSNFLIRVKDLDDLASRDARNNCDYGVYLCLNNYSATKNNGKYTLQLKVKAGHRYLFWIHSARSDFHLSDANTYSGATSVQFKIAGATYSNNTPPTPTPNTGSSDTNSASTTPPAINKATKTPAWAKRNEFNNIVVDSKSLQGSVSFDSEISFANVKSGFPLGHGLGENIENKLLYNLKLDGYGGLPMGSCLKRSYLMSDSDPTKKICRANENVDLLRDWSQFYARNGEVTRFKNTLIKNVDVRNAFRTYNYVDGKVVKTSYDLPHTDTFQSYHGGAAGEKNAQWLAIQDSIIKNSDNGGMIVGDTHYKGFLYQNLEVGCDSAFIADGLQRIRNDYIHHGAAPANEYVCANHIGAASYYYAPIWLINIEFTNPDVTVATNGAPVVVIGKNKDKLSIRFWGSGKRGEICRYDSIEDALNDKDVRDGCGNFDRPPFLELSCAGWKNPPTNCESRRGYIP